MTKGKDISTVQEANEIRSLINQKVAAPKDKQVEIRNKIRAIDFYCIDFSDERKEGGYTVQDFDMLIQTGQIKII